MAAADIEPLMPNPGGTVDPDDVVGREREHAELVKAVTFGGALLLGDRRHGKTSLLRKLARTLRQAGHAVVLVSAEVESIEAFGEALLAGLREEQPLSRGWGAWEKELGGELAVKVAGSGLKLTAKAKRGAEVEAEVDLLVVCARAAARAGKGRVVLLVDEITTLAMRLRDRGDDPSVFLSSLRNARQTHDNVSVVLAGSVGLHHAVSDPVEINDLPTVDVGPLAADDAVLLARRLLRYELGEQSNEEATARLVATSCSNIAYYIQALVPTLVAPPRGVAADPDAIVLDAIRHNDWKTDHYFDRITRYYGKDADVVEALVDGFAAAPSDLSVDEASQQLAVVELEQRPTRREMGLLLRRLSQDHYLTATDRGYAMATDVLRTIWLETRKRR